MLMGIITKSKWIAFLFILLFSCKTGSKMVEPETTGSLTDNKVEVYSQLNDLKNKEATVYGKIVQKEFVNKGGRATGVMETLIELKDGETVHIRNIGENKYEYEKLTGKKVEMKALIFYGNIDSDNPEHQSRVGFRIDFSEIKVID